MAERNVAGRAGQDGERAEVVEIRAGIEQTRVRMSDTLEQIGERLNPHHISEQVKDNLRNATIGKVETMARKAADRVSGSQQTLMETVRSNPLPAAMVGLGLGWLFINGRRQQELSARYGGSYDQPQYARGGDPAQRYAYAGGAQAGQVGGDVTTNGPSGPGAVDQVRERAGELGHQVKDTAGHLAERARETASTVTGQARTGARRVEDQFQDNPLALGAISLAMGMAAGFAIPATDREVALMGDARDRVVDRAQDVAREAADKVQHVASRVIDEAKTVTREASREEGLSL